MIKRKPWHGVSVWAITWALLAVLGVIFTSATAAAQPAETWRTGQSASYATGDDGALQRGTAWPAPRFSDNGDGTVTDNLTGLIWLKNANCFEQRTWADALNLSNSLASGSCGLTDGSLAGDWRLPNRKELFSLVDFSRYNPALPTGHPFTNVRSAYYWSASARASLTRHAWIVYMYLGSVYSSNKTNYSYVWPVRGGQGGDWECVSDLDGDGDVDGFDLMLFSHAYDEMSMDADLNGDGLVNSQDLAIFAGEFGLRSCDPD